MLITIIFSLLGILFIASIIVSGIAYKRQQSINLKKRQIRQLQQHINDYQDTLTALLKVDKDHELSLLLQRKVVKLHEKLSAIASENALFQTQLDTEKERLKEISEGKLNADATPIKESDEEIGIINLQLNLMTKLLSNAYKKNQIPKGRYAEHINHINHLRLEIEVESHIHQGERYADSNDWIMAQSHFKQAKEALRTTKIDFPEKNDQIRKLTDRIKEIQKRSFVTEDSKPENTATNTQQQ